MIGFRRLGGPQGVVIHAGQENKSFSKLLSVVSSFPNRESHKLL
mgnify:CR=1 FL=1